MAAVVSPKKQLEFELGIDLEPVIVLAFPTYILLVIKIGKGELPILFNREFTLQNMALDICAAATKIRIANSSENGICL